MKKILAGCFFIQLSFALSAQLDTAQLLQDYESRFLEKIAQYEGFPPVPFRAPDTEGQEHYLEHYQGQILILQFWNLYCEPCLTQMNSLNRIVKEYTDQGVSVLSFASEYGKELKDFMAFKKLKFPVVPNSSNLATEAYGGDLGFPRLFIIDKYGTIQRVIISGDMYDEMDAYKRLKPIIEELLKV